MGIGGSACDRGSDEGAGGGAQLGISSSVIEDIKSNIKSTIEKHTNVNNTFIKNGQSIIIKQTGEYDPYAPMYSKELKKRFLGLEYKNCGFQYNCLYNIKQGSSVSVSSFNKDVTKEAENLFTDIKSELEKNSNMELSGGNKGLMAIAAEMDRSKEDIKKNIDKVLTTINTNEIDKDQKIVIEYISPPKCEDPCGDDETNPGPRGPTLEQDAQIEILSDQIISSALEVVSKKISDKQMSASTDISDFNMECIISMLIRAGIILSIGVGIYIVAKKFTGKKKKMI